MFKTDVMEILLRTRRDNPDWTPMQCLTAIKEDLITITQLELRDPPASQRHQSATEEQVQAP